MYHHTHGNNRLGALLARVTPLLIADVPATRMCTVMPGAPAKGLFTTVPRFAVGFATYPEAQQPTTPFELTGPCVKFW